MRITCPIPLTSKFKWRDGELAGHVLKYYLQLNSIYMISHYLFPYVDAFRYLNLYPTDTWYLLDNGLTTETRQHT